MRLPRRQRRGRPRRPRHPRSSRHRSFVKTRPFHFFSPPAEKRARRASREARRRRRATRRSGERAPRAPGVGTAPSARHCPPSRQARAGGPACALRARRGRAPARTRRGKKARERSTRRARAKTARRARTRRRSRSGDSRPCLSRLKPRVAQPSARASRFRRVGPPRAARPPAPPRRRSRAPRAVARAARGGGPRARSRRAGRARPRRRAEARVARRCGREQPCRVCGRSPRRATEPGLAAGGRRRRTPTSSRPGGALVARGRSWSAARAPCVAVAGRHEEWPETWLRNRKSEKRAVDRVRSVSRALDRHPHANPTAKIARARRIARVGNFSTAF